MTTDFKQIWHCEFSIPREEAVQLWNTNRRYVVFAPTAEQAIDAIRKEFPKATIHKVIRDTCQRLIIPDEVTKA